MRDISTLVLFVLCIPLHLKHSFIDFCAKRVLIIKICNAYSQFAHVPTNRLIEFERFLEQIVPARNRRSNVCTFSRILPKSPRFLSACPTSVDMFYSFVHKIKKEFSLISKTAIFHLGRAAKVSY